MTTIFAFIAPYQRTWGYSIHGIKGLYTSKEQPMEIEHLTDIFAKEENTLAPLSVYEKEVELPEIIQKCLNPSTDRHLSIPVLQKKEGEVYAVVPNTDPTEGAGYKFIWVLTTDPLLANKIACGNGVHGSNADVVALALNKNIEPELMLRRRKNGELSDDLYW